MIKKIITKSYYTRDNIPVKEKDSYKTESKITLYLFRIPVLTYRIIEIK